MTVVAKLSLVLRANDVEIAQSEDPQLWQQVLLAITGVQRLAPPSSPSAASAEIEVRGAPLQQPAADPPHGNDPASRMAAAAGVTLAVLQGACTPTAEAPYMVLDAHCYEAMRRSLPSRGTRAIGNIQIAGTLLGLWFHYAGLGNVSQAQSQAVLDPLGMRDSNAPRGIANADWLQSRTSGQFIVNPARISHALTIARCFCAREWSEYLNS